MNHLFLRLACLTAEKRLKGALPNEIVKSLLQEIEKTHRIVDPEIITEGMLEASFNSLPEHYDPPDPKRKPWHGFKAKRRYTAMVKAAPTVWED